MAETEIVQLEWHRLLKARGATSVEVQGLDGSNRLRTIATVDDPPIGDGILEMARKARASGEPHAADWFVCGLVHGYMRGAGLGVPPVVVLSEMG